MLVTGLPSMVSGMVNAPDAFLSQPVMVTASPSVSYFKWGLTDTASAGLVSATGSSGLTSCCFSSTGLTSSLGAVGFSLTDSEPSDDDFSPHPPISRGRDTDKRRIALMGSGLLMLLQGGLPPRGIENSSRFRRPDQARRRSLKWGLEMWESDGRITKILAENPPKTGKYPPRKGTIFILEGRFLSAPPYA